jgi:hypothetical protein
MEKVQKSEIKRMLLHLAYMVTARILMLTVGTIGFIWSLVKYTARSLRKRSWIHLVAYLDDYFHTIALSDDQRGNVVCRDLFNDLMIKRSTPAIDRYDYGHEDQTVSHVTGVNEKSGYLGWIGIALAWALNRYDPGHTQRAAENEQYNPPKLPLILKQREEAIS